MQDLTTQPKYMPAGALRSRSGWDTSLSNPFYPRLKRAAYKGSGFDYGERIPQSPVMGRPELAMSSERLHNAQINEGLGAGPNRLTLGESYDSGLGGFWESMGKAFRNVAAYTMAVPSGGFSLALATSPTARRFGAITSTAVMPLVTFMPAGMRNRIFNLAPGQRGGLETEAKISRGLDIAAAAVIGGYMLAPAAAPATGGFSLAPTGAGSGVLASQAAASGGFSLLPTGAGYGVLASQAAASPSIFGSAFNFLGKIGPYVMQAASLFGGGSRLPSPSADLPPLPSISQGPSPYSQLGPSPLSNSPIASSPSPAQASFGNTPEQPGLLSSIPLWAWLAGGGVIAAGILISSKRSARQAA